MGHFRFLQLVNDLPRKVIVYGRMIRFGHTLFALPFALSAMILAGWETRVTGWLVFWIILAMMGARSAAMGFNRLVDAGFDAANPRTALRELPTGAISSQETKIFVSGAIFVFCLSAAMISWICFWLSFPVLAILLGYSYTKRFTWLCHFILGFAIGLAPLGVWLAVTGDLSWRIALLSVALWTYIAGFDVLYACQDLEFDRTAGLNSLPARFGVKAALRMAKLTHLVTFLSLLALWPVFSLSNLYPFFLVVIGLLLVWEHKLVRPEDLSRIEVVFFHVNSAISVVVFAAFLAEEIVRHWQ